MNSIKQVVVKTIKIEPNKTTDAKKNCYIYVLYWKEIKDISIMSSYHPVNSRSSHRFQINSWNFMFETINCCSGYTYY